MGVSNVASSRLERETAASEGPPAPKKRELAVLVSENCHRATCRVSGSPLTKRIACSRKESRTHSLLSLSLRACAGVVQDVVVCTWTNVVKGPGEFAVLVLGGGGSDARTTLVDRSSAPRDPRRHHDVEPRGRRSAGDRGLSLCPCRRSTHSKHAIRFVRWRCAERDTEG